MMLPHLFACVLLSAYTIVGNSAAPTVTTGAAVLVGDGFASLQKSKAGMQMFLCL